MICIIMSSNKDIATHSERLTGRVKWFNNKAGYGFITVTDGSRSGTDVFVHHSAVQVENQQYKYLVQGEYVEFDISSTPSGNHPFQATNVSGIKAGKLMCETRREFKIARTTYRSTSATDVKEDTQEFKMPSQRRAPRTRGEGPRESSGPRESVGDKKEWTMVKGNSRARPPRSNEATK
jgi:CspA family cold shock protein